MRLIKPSYKILKQTPGLQGIYEQIELAGRICYASTHKIQYQENEACDGQMSITAKPFVDRMIASQHYAMLEHGTVYLKIPTRYIDISEKLDIPIISDAVLKYQNNPYSKVNLANSDEDVFFSYITTNYRVLVENGWLDDLKYLCEPTEFHEKRVTVMFTTSNGVMREATRHRVFSFAVESTRYCNYSKDKFNNELTFIAPSWMSNSDISNVPFYLTGEEFRMDIKSLHLINALTQCESCYLSMIKDGAKPQEAREVLPLATKCDVVMTGFVSDWQHLCRLRSSFAETGQPHPDMKALVDPLLEEFIACGYLEPLV